MMITASCNTTCVHVRNGCFTCMATQPIITKRKLIRRNDYYCFDDDIKKQNWKNREIELEKDKVRDQVIDFTKNNMNN